MLENRSYLKPMTEFKKLPATPAVIFIYLIIFCLALGGSAIAVRLPAQDDSEAAVTSRAEYPATPASQVQLTVNAPILQNGLHTPRVFPHIVGQVAITRRQTAVVDRMTTLLGSKIGHQPVYTELVARGGAPSEVLSLTRSFKGVFDFRNAQPDDEYQICLTPQKKVQKLTYRTGLTDQYVAVRTDAG